MFYSDNPVRDFERHAAEQERKLNQRPLCDYCDNPIQGAFYYEINGDCICEDCLKAHFRKEVREDE